MVLPALDFIVIYISMQWYACSFTYIFEYTHEQTVETGLRMNGIDSDTKMQWNSSLVMMSQCM